MTGNGKQNLLIFGATGYIGTYIVDQIIANKESFGRIAVFTSPSTVEKKPEVIEKFRKAGLELFVGNSTKEEDVVNALKGSSFQAKWGNRT